MSRPVGIRSKKSLYKRILNLLKKYPDGLVSYQIALKLKVNNCTIQRTYLKDLVAEGKIVATPIERRRILYSRSPDGNTNDKV